MHAMAEPVVEAILARTRRAGATSEVVDADAFDARRANTREEATRATARAREDAQPRRELALRMAYAPRKQRGPWTDENPRTTIGSACRPAGHRIRPG